jgi:predicted GIY-YIG superfamily endonuclease
MSYVYILRSKTHPEQTYIGSTQSLRQRLADHNSGKSFHTRKFIPWNLISYVAFPERSTAEKFERYLKSGSGRAFAQRHLFSSSLTAT